MQTRPSSATLFAFVAMQAFSKETRVGQMGPLWSAPTITDGRTQTLDLANEWRMEKEEDHLFSLDDFPLLFSSPIFTFKNEKKGVLREEKTFRSIESSLAFPAFRRENHRCASKKGKKKPNSHWQHFFLDIMDGSIWATLEI